MKAPRLTDGDVCPRRFLVDLAPGLREGHVWAVLVRRGDGYGRSFPSFRCEHGSRHRQWPARADG
jgi:hypothetical protein